MNLFCSLNKNNGMFSPPRSIMFFFLFLLEFLNLKEDLSAPIFSIGVTFPRQIQFLISKSDFSAFLNSQKIGISFRIFLNVSIVLYRIIFR